jgi:hypothetical protein
MRRLPLLLLASLLSACSAVAPLAQPPHQFDDEHERFDRPDAAAAFDAMKRTGTDDVQARYDDARRQMRAMPRYATNGDRTLAPLIRSRIEPQNDATGSVGTWSFLGPGNIGGRTRALLIDPTDTRVMYAAAISGGVFKSIDRGASWIATGDFMANLDVSSLAFDPNDSRTMYAATGEGYFREDVRGTALPLRGNGIFVTHDAGANWAQLPSTATADFQWVNDIVVSPSNAHRIYAAARSGVWRSLDSGQTWTRILSTAVKGGALDLLVVDASGSDLLFASCGVFDHATVYRTLQAEGDATFESVLSESGMGRTTLAVAPSNHAIVYALAAANGTAAGVNYDQGVLGVFRSDSAGAAGSWRAQFRNSATSDRVSQLLLTNPLSAMGAQCRGGFGSSSYVNMGWHSNVIAVDPTNPDRLFAGGVDLFRSDDGGRSWNVASYWWTDSNDGAFVHADQHAIVFDPGYDGAGNRRLFATNDGGLFVTDDATAALGTGASSFCDPRATHIAWRTLNHDYGATQFYNGAASADGRWFLGGAQDNGTSLGRVTAASSTLPSGVNGWTMIYGGDGAYVAIDPVDSSVYFESQYGDIAKSTDAATTINYSVYGATNGLSDSGFLFVTPFVIDGSHHQRLWTGGQRLWRSDDSAGHWTAASAPFAASISAIAVAAGRPERVIAGTTDGRLIRNDAATTASATTVWQETAPRGGYVSSITFDPTNVDVVYATYAGFGGAHVWRSADGGVTWQPLDGEGTAMLPDLPAHALAVDPARPSRLYLGTDLGIFVSTDGGAHWNVENSGFPNVITESVFVGQGAWGPAVYAFTHGRGAWRAELTSAPHRRASRP